ncbi:hypothetical protein MSAN_01049200 [Mycena sanguinolenta]|uniref:3-oxoacyl-[acyl-carrier-protein] reductase n=1 Tax=Mycena sanguinolenta TaxID=230812 RepID=A0A8H7D9R2_9AGAR|nr:hypothetical protein MSAN_01049200 [Mycena sanguinolenta]
MSTATQEYTRVAIVTGASRGIGKGIALRLAADGLDVVVADLADQKDPLDAVAEEIRGLGRKALTVSCDVSKEDEVQAMVVAAVSELGRLDVMVANAGVSLAGSVMDAEIEAWEKCWAVNIKGVLFCYKHAARQMVKQGTGGRIIGAISSHVSARPTFNHPLPGASSVCGQRGYANVGAYCISKAAVRSLTQTTALELREHNITVNAYGPGAIDTAMVANPLDEVHGAGYFVKQLLKIPEGVRTGQPSDVANVVSFLVSPQSHFVTGQTLCVDDGIHFT